LNHLYNFKKELGLQYWSKSFDTSKVCFYW
jgi:hypothetical protein